MQKLILLLSLIVALGYCSVGLRVNPDDLTLIDPQGRTRIYHGVNVVYKVFPYYPEYDGEWNPMNSFNQEDVQYLRKWGFNNIRLYIAWDGVEPTEGNYDMKYFENIKNIVALCEEGGIDVYLDFHQDLFSEYFCGEGLPSWIVDKVMPRKDQDFPYPLEVELQKDDLGYPEQKDCHKKQFFEFYKAWDVQQISQDLTLNTEGIADSLGQFWQLVALEFRDISNILGYEFINEPFGINQYDNPPEDLIPGVQMNKYMLPFYDLLNTYIRAVDKKSLVFYESVQGEIGNTGFERNVGGPAYQPLEVYSYHIYCPEVNLEGEPTDPVFCKGYDKDASDAAIEHYKKINIAGWLTEFGALGNTEKDADELDNVLGNADTVFNSWSYWQYKYYNDITTAAPKPDTEGFWFENGELQATKVAALSRAYAYMICGNPQLMNWNRKEQIFELQVKLNRAQCNSSYHTEIYLSESFHYQNGFNVEFENCPTCYLEPLGEQSYYKIAGDQILQDLETWTLKVTPKDSSNENDIFSWFQKLYQ